MLTRIRERHDLTFYGLCWINGPDAGHTHSHIVVGNGTNRVLVDMKDRCERCLPVPQDE